jgi:G:T-mismatch repair DNA endonuclease (very short patch repair protein)
MDKAVTLIFNAKINSKNAFDIETDFFSDLSKISKNIQRNNKEESKVGEMSWLKASIGLDACAKIYGFRVD